MNKVILASSSIYRKRLLQRLISNFECESPEIDETRLPEESPQALVERLSLSKAEKISRSHPDCWVIGSDQVGLYKGEILGKPGSFEKAVSQLRLFSGGSFEFLTGVSLYHGDKNIRLHRLVTTQVKFKPLTDKTIRQYLLQDTPYDCAGAFKVESRGIALFESIISEDPTALEGLPLIALCGLFEKAGINILDISR